MGLRKRREQFQSRKVKIAYGKQNQMQAQFSEQEAKLQKCMQQQTQQQDQIARQESTTSDLIRQVLKMQDIVVSVTNSQDQFQRKFNETVIKEQFAIQLNGLIAQSSQEVQAQLDSMMALFQTLKSDIDQEISDWKKSLKNFYIRQQEKTQSSQRYSKQIASFQIQMNEERSQKNQFQPPNYDKIPFNTETSGDLGHAGLHLQTSADKQIDTQDEGKVQPPNQSSPGCSEGVAICKAKATTQQLARNVGHIESAPTQITNQDLNLVLKSTLPSQTPEIQNVTQNNPQLLGERSKQHSKKKIFDGYTNKLLETPEKPEGCSPSKKLNFDASQNKKPMVSQTDNVTCFPSLQEKVEDQLQNAIQMSDSQLSVEIYENQKGLQDIIELVKNSRQLDASAHQQYPSTLDESSAVVGQKQFIEPGIADNPQFIVTQSSPKEGVEPEKQLNQHKDQLQCEVQSERYSTPSYSYQINQNYEFKIQNYQQRVMENELNYSRKLYEQELLQLSNQAKLIDSEYYAESKSYSKKKNYDNGMKQDDDDNSSGNDEVMYREDRNQQGK